MDETCERASFCDAGLVLLLLPRRFVHRPTWGRVLRMVCQMRQVTKEKDHSWTARNEFVGDQRGLPHQGSTQ